MRVLLVDDNPEKSERVRACLLARAGLVSSDVECVSDGISARRELKGSKYDVLIIDIVIPQRAGEVPRGSVSLSLLDEIDSRDLYQTPEHIVGLTAFEDEFELAQRRFAKSTWMVIRYQESELQWEEQLAGRIRHIQAARGSALRGYLSEVAVVCALADPELAAVKRLPWQWTTFKEPGDSTVYFRGAYSTDSGTKYAYAAAASRMGMPAVSVLATKMAVAFRPRYLAMVGLAAGVRGRVNLGDVLAADPCWDYGSGKYKMDGTSSKFLPAPHQLPLDPDVREKIGMLGQDEQHLATIRAGWQGEVPETVLKIVRGPLASGSAVLADGLRVKEVTKQHRELVGIEMEAYGVFMAATEAPHPRPIPIALKSVCDFGDGKKNDRFQGYAAHASAGVLAALLQKYLH